MAFLMIITPVGAGIIDFDGLSKGEVLSTQFQASHGVTFSANNKVSGHPDKLVIFDTFSTAGSGDPDLAYPWAGGNLNVDNDPDPNTSQDVRLYNVFCIAENDVDNDGNGLIDVPDDEAGGGTIFIKWNRDIVDVRLAQLDLDERPDRNRIKLYNDGNLVLNKTFAQLFGSVPGVTFADHFANQLPYLSTVATFGAFDEMRI